MLKNIMLKDIEIYERVLAVSAKDDNKIAMYPTLFTAPCILPLRDNKQKEITFKNNLSEVTVYSPKGLPHGHYARQIIAYLTTLVRQNESDEIVISRSISSLFNECRGKRMGGHNQVIFESTLEKVLELTIHRKNYSKKGNSEFDIRKSALVSEYSLTRRKNGKKIEISFKPSTSFRSLIIQKGEAHPIDLRALHFFRSNDRVLANDLYIFLSRKAV